MFVTGANLTVPFFIIILAKLMGPSRSSWRAAPTRPPISAPLGPPNNSAAWAWKGGVKLRYRNDLAAIEDPEERLAKCEGMVAKLYDIGTAMNQASYFRFDDTIDPADTWRWVVNLLKSIHLAPKPEGRDGPAADTRQRSEFILNNYLLTEDYITTVPTHRDIVSPHRQDPRTASSHR
jgi:acetyl-CoA carboxylase carboxyltransferase component